MLFRRRAAPEGAALETFLGGMETRHQPTGYVAVPGTLKPSLVEWKQTKFSKFLSFSTSLKPSLVEWKLEQRKYTLWPGVP